jgi:hypothetical protein
MEKTTRILLAIAIAAWAGDGAAAQWKQIAKASIGELWLDVASVKRNNGEVAFEYRIDYPKVQRVTESKDLYRSTVTKAMVRCATRSISIGPAIAYAGTRASGKVVGTFPPAPEEARFQPVEPKTSDENLWQHVCKIAQVTPNPKK